MIFSQTFYKFPPVTPVPIRTGKILSGWWNSLCRTFVIYLSPDHGQILAWVFDDDPLVN